MSANLHVYPRLNLGCGSVYLPEWTNVEFKSPDSSVIEHDLREPLPFRDSSFQVVYHSHVLEHLEPLEAAQLLEECHRVLAPGGILRMVVPDLESKARLYLEKLETVENNISPSAIDDYDWSVIELLDQLVRRRSGGQMAEYLRREPLPDYARKRLGDEVGRVRSVNTSDQRPTLRSRILHRLKHLGTKIGMVLCDIRPEERAVAHFFRQGECHRWMYDRSSLRRVLECAGFRHINQVDANTSSIEDWDQSGRWLDAPDGKVRRPDSIYLEARKP